MQFYLGIRYKITRITPIVSKLTTLSSKNISQALMSCDQLGNNRVIREPFEGVSKASVQRGII